MNVMEEVETDFSERCPEKESKATSWSKEEEDFYHEGGTGCPKRLWDLSP